MTINGLVLCDDLLFGSQITGTAQALGRKVRIVKDAELLLKHADDYQPSAVFLDIQTTDLNLNQLVTSLRAIKPALMIVAFGSHVDTQRLELARNAGCDVVLPRSAFVQRLPNELATWLSGSGLTS